MNMKYTFEKDFVVCEEPYHVGYFEAKNGKTLPMREQQARMLIEICNFLELELTDRISISFPYAVCKKLGMKSVIKIT